MSKNKKDNQSKKNGGSWLPVLVGVAVLVAACSYWIRRFDMMNGLSNHHAMGWLSLQAAITTWCLTPGALEQFDISKGDSHWDPTVEGTERDFVTTGETREDEYEKASIYSLLYGLYRSVGKVKHTNGDLYQFTFNTWGISNPEDKPYGPEEPQRHGKAAYHGLTTFDAVQKRVAENPDLHIVEIGCGTGAGANLITREVLPTVNYHAVDMQLGAIETCKQIHATPDNPRLNCVHGNGQRLPFEDNSMDIALVSETHIAEAEIGPEEKKIFSEMVRVLKPGGLFVWGNALPTKVWWDAKEYLTRSLDFKMCGPDIADSWRNHTASAVLARDQDEDRVNLYVDQVFENFPVFGWRPKCRAVSDRLLKNFYRHPGTDLYLRMVTGDDSYMHLCFQVPE
jgi:SAM-dependent methyltransferase